MNETRTLYFPSSSVRASGTDDRTILGIAAPFNELAKIRGWEGNFLEKIAPGAFKRTIAERGHKIRLLEQHDQRQFPIGKATFLEERSNGLFAEFKIANTRAGDEALALVRDGVVDGFSIGFEVKKDVWSGVQAKTKLRVRTLLEVKLNEISLCTFPAYAGAGVTGTRNRIAHLQEIKGFTK